MVWFNMDAIPKSDIKSVIKSEISFDISIKPTSWIGHSAIGNNEEILHVCTY